MLSLLDPRIWLGALLAIALTSGFSYFNGVQHGKQVLRAEYASAVAEANREARATEQRRQRNVDDAANAAAARERNLRASAGDARTESDGLRSDIDALGRVAHSLATADEAFSRASRALTACSKRHSELAADADIADLEARELRQAWPK